MRSHKRSREEVIPEVRDAFRRHGYDGASLSILSEATKLGRASLYHHFPGGKEEMASAALDDVEAIVAVRIVGALQSDAPPAERLAAMCRELSVYYDGGRLACLCGVLALTAPPYRARVQLIFQLWATALSAVAADAGRDQRTARSAAEKALARIQGALVLAAAQDGPQPFRRALRDLPCILFGDGDYPPLKRHRSRMEADEGVRLALKRQDMEPVG